MPEQENQAEEHINFSIEQIDDIPNDDILKILEASPVFIKEYEITFDDYDAIRARAKVIAKEGPFVFETLLVLAYTDRMEHKGYDLDQQLKQLDDNVIQTMVLLKTKMRFSSEEIEALRNSNEPPKDFIDKRAAIRATLHDTYVTVDNNDIVIGSGDSPEEASRRAQEENSEDRNNV